MNLVLFYLYSEQEYNVYFTCMAQEFAAVFLAFF